MAQHKTEGAVVEYFGDGVAGLSVPGRATCTNMGAELGVTTSIFPADEVTGSFLAAQGRADHFEPLAAEADPAYDRMTKLLDAERTHAVDALRAAVRMLLSSRQP